MIVIRNRQLEEMAGPARARFVGKMRVHLRASFPEATQAFDDRQLERLIAGGVAEAGRYDLHGERQACQFLNLCAVHGWDFLKEPQHRWMIDDYLENREISDPGDRITLLADSCVSRLRVEETNRSLQERSFPAPEDDVEADDDTDEDPDNDAANVPLLDKT